MLLANLDRLFEETMVARSASDNPAHIAVRGLKGIMKAECQRIAGEATARNQLEGCVLAQNQPPTNHQAKCPQGAAMFSEHAWREIARSLRLSGRELQIVRAVFDDHTESAIAANLHVSPHTIHTHCERLYRKLGVTDRVRLVLRIMGEFIALTLAAGSVMPPICPTQAAGRCPFQR